jgi:hypothetical protein
VPGCLVNQCRTMNSGFVWGRDKLVTPLCTALFIVPLVYVCLLSRVVLGAPHPWLIVHWCGAWNVAQDTQVLRHACVVRVAGVMGVRAS